VSIYDSGTLGSSEYDKINRINASIGGFFQGNEIFIIDFLNLEVILEKSCVKTDKAVIKKPITNKLAKKLKKKLKEINLLDWKEKYIDLEILDGTQWSVEIIIEKRIIRKHGSNKYPKEWELFHSMLDSLKKMRKG